ncbi:unnamed protein product [Effrenium voratum]|nr:unnamed protein product [Effrenium voratum]
MLHAKQRWEDAGCPEHTAETRHLSNCQKRVKILTQEVSHAQARLKDGVSRGDPLVCTSTGFVTFTTELMQRLASREQYTRDVTDFHITMPPDPNDLPLGLKV